MPFRVLSIDGGGVRGLIPATVLARLEQLTGRPVHELFDLVVGTSTGGILTLGLTAPGPDGGPRYRAAELIRLYEEESPAIFSRSLTYRVRSANGVTNARYPSTGLEQTLTRYFGDLRLRDVLGDVLITTYETEIRQPFLIRSRRARSEPGYDFRVRDVARATSAAPTFFPPVRITAADERSWTLIDGGVYANNPTMVGIVEAMAAYGQDDVLTVSLGTGNRTRPLPYARIRSWGLVQWARPLVDIVFDGVTSTVDFQAAQLGRITDEVQRHARFDVDLTVASDDLDDTSPANLAALGRLAMALVERRSADLERLASELTAGADR
jgi:uncharacterized protein